MSLGNCLSRNVLTNFQSDSHNVVRDTSLLTFRNLCNFTDVTSLIPDTHNLSIHYSIS